MSTRESELVIQDITSYVCQAAGSWYGDASIRSVVPEIVTRPWSFMLRYPLAKSVDRTGAVLVKVARHQKMDLARSVKERALLERTEREFGMLSAIATVFQEENGAHEFCFVRPLEILPQWNAIVMEELESRTLKTYILKPRIILGLTRDWTTIETLLLKGARWLHQYHQGMGDVQESRLADTGLSRRIDQILERLAVHIPEQTLGPIKSYLMERSIKLADRKVVVAMLHSDFHCGNILITPEGHVGALDADLARGPIYQDIAKYFADLNTRGIQVLTRGGFIRTCQLEKCYRAILQGYFGVEEYDEELLRFFISIAILEKWMIDENSLRQSTGTKSLIFKVLSSWRRNYFLRLLHEQMERIPCALP